MKIEKQIFASFSESEIVNISKTRLEIKNQIEVIDYHIESLYYRNKINNNDFDSIRNILLKVKEI